MKSTVFLFHPDIATHLENLDIFYLESTISVSSLSFWTDYKGKTKPHFLNGDDLNEWENE